jgi:hypothetical protein
VSPKDDFPPADHAMGLELQLEELIEQQRRAVVQGRSADADRLAAEIAALQQELAAAAERAAEPGRPPDPGPSLRDAEDLSS